MSVPQLEHTLEKRDKSARRRTFGRWSDFQIIETFQPDGVKRIKEVFRFIVNDEETVREYWGFDGMVTVTAGQNLSSHAAAHGAILTLHMRSGQTTSDFWEGVGTQDLIPQGVQINEVARPQRFIPFAVLGNPASTRGSVVLPARAIFPREIRLLPGESWVLSIGLVGTAAADPSPELAIRGYARYRYLDGSA